MLRLRLKEIKKVYVLESDYSKVWVEFYDDDPETCYITHLFVHSESRNKGYGRKTMTNAEAIARELGATKLMLMVSTDGWLRAWYEDMGYKLHSYEDEEDVWMIKEL